MDNFFEGDSFMQKDIFLNLLNILRKLYFIENCKKKIYWGKKKFIGKNFKILCKKIVFFQPDEKRKSSVFIKSKKTAFLSWKSSSPKAIYIIFILNLLFPEPIFLICNKNLLSISLNLKEQRLSKMPSLLMAPGKNFRKSSILSINSSLI